MTATITTPSGADALREFQEWLNSKRGFSVSEVFHDISEKFAAALAAQAQEAAPAAQGEPSDTERNAARYLWLRERISVWRTNDGKGPVSWFPVIKVPASSRIQDETDAAIDAARSAQKKGGAE